MKTKERVLIWVILASLVIFNCILVFGMIPAQNRRATRQQQQIKEIQETLRVEKLKKWGDDQ